MITIRRALLSVTNKDGIVTFAQGLQRHGVEILSTGGTAAALRGENIEVTDVSHYTGFPEMMDGRLKTLHPKIHGGLLGRREIDAAVMKQNGIVPIDMVVVNLYPFETVIQKPGCNFHDAVEHIDIGGPAMIRSAAKNYQWTTVVVNPARYHMVLRCMDTHAGCITVRQSRMLMNEAFTLTARYDTAISRYLQTAE